MVSTGALMGSKSHVRWGYPHHSPKSAGLTDIKTSETQHHVIPEMLVRLMVRYEQFGGFCHSWRLGLFDLRRPNEVLRQPLNPENDRSLFEPTHVVRVMQTALAVQPDGGAAVLGSAPDKVQPPFLQA